MTTTNLKGWALLHSPLPKEALKPLSEYVYGVKNLTDVNEGYLIERLHQSGLDWNFVGMTMDYHGTQARIEGKDDRRKERIYHLASFMGVLEIETEIGSGKFRRYAGAGASDNVRLDAAFKGAKTTAFKNACKEAGLTAELYKGGRAMDVFYDQVPDEVVNPAARANAAAFEGKQQQQTTTTTPSPNPGVQEFSNDAAERRSQLLTFLHSHLPEDPEARGKAGAAYKAAEAREKGTGFDAGFALLEELHGKHHGEDCQHMKVAYAALSEGGDQAAA